MVKEFVTPDKRPFTEGPLEHQRWNEDYFRKLIEYAISFNMSDIKLVPEYPPYIRVYGNWYNVNDIPVIPNDVDTLVSVISGSNGLPTKVRAGEFADFAYEINLDRFNKRRFRCNATACLMSGGQSGISLVLRTIPDNIPTIEEVGLVDENGDPGYILQNMFPPQGIVLFTGPTGSGKTTTLAGGIGYLLVTHPNFSVETYEDPIEFDYRTAHGTGPLVQVNVTDHLGGDFTKIAPNAARRSSDIVIVGETRDRNSFRGLIQLSEMGMLTISTLHTRSVAETPTRILNTFPADEQPEIKTSLLHGLRLVVQQRLLPTVDKRRCPVREWLVFSEPIRYELSQLKTSEMIPYLRECTKKYGRLLIEDVFDKYQQGRISEATYRRMEAEHEESVEASKAGAAA